ncbi:MAG: AraC family transcriptional regulator [Bacteroidaceae bacterium]|nr:AraC family transcriptional regulator [Bacteroidaceae bacterium]
MGKYNLTEKKMRAPLYRSLLNPEMVENMYQAIMAKFVVEKKYRNPEYSAQKLADELNTNTRYISAVINLRYQDNYSQMVNEFRIKDAMYLLKDKHSQKMTMEDIALTVGFSNRQSFYAAFYKRTGITPREYRQKNMAQIETQLNDRRKRLKESRAKKKMEE